MGFNPIFCVLYHLQLFVNPWTVACQLHEIFQARILEWFAISSSRGSSWPRAWTWDSWPPAGQVGSLPLFHSGFPGGSDGKESACSAGDSALIPGLGKFPWRWEWQPTPVRLPGESRGLVGYRLWSLKMSDTIERIQFYWHLNKKRTFGQAKGTQLICMCKGKTMWEHKEGGSLQAKERDLRKN